VSDDDNIEVLQNLQTLVRNRRNSPVFAVPQFKRMPDFWGWYKYFMQSHNQEGVSGVCFTLIIPFPPSEDYKTVLVYPYNQSAL